MTVKLALIVDDSRTARELLARVLEDHGLDVMASGSAEDAMEYLSENRPDVIFMDHMMPGMDGFEALRAIKENPDTATIPVMMYTSQAGELYVGQARALGAVGVLPKQIGPVDVSRMLESLHLVPDAGAVAEGETQPADSEQPKSNLPAQAGYDTAYVARELSRQQRRFIREESDLATTRIIDSLRDFLASHAAGDNRRTSWSAILLAVVAVCATWFAWSSYRDALSLANENARLRFQIPSTPRVAPATSGAGSDASYELETPLGDDTLATIEWALNASSSYPYGEVPLGDERMAMLEQLVIQLRRIGFAGVVRLESHVGRFCEVRSEQGGWSLASPDTSLAECGGLAADAAAAIAASARQSVAFANSLALLSDPGGDIRVQVEPLGNDIPLIPYPYVAAEVLAGDWNEVAALNNRVEVRLLPDL